ncbi:hypothetical protein, conserved [Babesia bigemina]|uniref:CBF1-interacting co-repressor CIR N-terminal domain-containing protein n=1 Tax=Babesia bigemina TaxID=5866 RepID=A0A061DAK9_BABBI|nr:hypothetical protein, conserved [Babesia bigemina]CDR97726.1 hypothetical protein, conserved [Babesia bigemina]|eukprot:XP_012769912.1 hypothetical protein, conserved [Babesia bigemina]
MGGHGGLNILPQKKWNVYRADRRYEVKYDEHRDIERRLDSRDQRKRQRLTDSLVELRRQSQAVRNIESDGNKPEGDSGLKEERRHSRRRNNRKPQPVPVNRSRSPSPASTAGSRGILQSEPSAEAAELVPLPEFDKKASGGHINLFEEAERDANERAKRQRENLIKSGSYVYNAASKGPRVVSVYTDGTPATLVPDFKPVCTPWYMRQRPGDVDGGVAVERPRGPRYCKTVSTFDDADGYYEERELKRSFATKLAKFQQNHALPKD